MQDLLERIFNIKSKSEFEDLCIEVLEFQIKKNPLYSSYAKMILNGKTITTINDIPFLPIEFFKKEQVICSSEKIEKIFISSGTTGEKSKHLISDIEIYKKSLKESFKNFYGEISEYCILALIPNYNENQDSSLIYMINHFIKSSNHSQSKIFGNNFKDLYETILDLEHKGQKVILFGISYALLDFAEKFSTRLNHTIIVETGGMKGKRKELVKEDLHNILKSAFSLENIHSEYGMTELLSQSYSKGDNIFFSPPWKKIIIRDINDPLSIIHKNQTGGINIIDLANIYSCPFIETQDLGKNFTDNSFSVIGRFDNSDLRGCNLLSQ
tara:strand:+ start:135 stop:1112 length:978 start_codon:yes stop_codon:yes gene_type:complete